MLFNVIMFEFPIIIQIIFFISNYYSFYSVIISCLHFLYLLYYIRFEFFRFLMCMTLLFHCVVGLIYPSLIFTLRVFILMKFHFFISLFVLCCLILALMFVFFHGFLVNFVFTFMILELH